MSDKVRQAVVIVHGMGEQKPLDTLNGFIDTALPGSGRDQWYSRPDKVTDSYESRRYLAPRRMQADDELYAQTEVYEYHWAHLIRGNRLDDLWSTVRRILLSSPANVPTGLRVVWFLFWAAIIWTAWAFWAGPFSDIDLRDLSGIGAIENLLRTLIGGGLIAAGLAYLLTRILPSWLTTSFVDVVRYVDTSPRSYATRRQIRKGMVDLLQGIHDATDFRGRQRYQRIIVVAHSLGAYIAYDGITYLWARMNKLHAGSYENVPDPHELPAGLNEYLAAESALGANGDLDAFRDAQRGLWLGLRMNGNPWLITDFVTAGTPMYFADRLYTKNRKAFEERIRRNELPQCPPLPDPGPTSPLGPTWKNGSRRVLYHGAPFAVIRWTNLWFPAGGRFFGDWFGGPLAPLYGSGIRDIPVTGNTPKRWIPGYSHALYFKFPNDESAGSVTAGIQDALDLAATSWLSPTLAAPPPTPGTAVGTGHL